MLSLKLNDGPSDVSPVQLLREGDAWLELWDHARARHSTPFPAFYCLFTALEFYLKAYIVRKDKSYASTDRLKSLGHNFNEMYRVFKDLSDDGNFSDQLLNELKKYHLLGLKLDVLKYPQIRAMWMVDRDLSKGIHSLSYLFDNIRQTVLQDPTEWLLEKYPKKLKTTLVFQIDYPGDIKALSDDEIKTLMSLCTKCLPVGVIVSEGYNFPWSEDLLPVRKCPECKNAFLPMSGIRSRQ